MVKVTGNLDNRTFYKGNHYRVNESVEVEFERDGFLYIFGCLPGFLFDGASVPKFVRWFIKPWSKRLVVPSFVHDIAFILKLFGYDWAADIMGFLMEETKAWERFFVYPSVKTFIAKRIYGITEENDLINRELCYVRVKCILQEQ